MKNPQPVKILDVTGSLTSNTCTCFSFDSSPRACAQTEKHSAHPTFR